MELTKTELRLMCSALVCFNNREMAKGYNDQWSMEEITELHSRAASELVDRWENELRAKSAEKEITDAL